MLNPKEDERDLCLEFTNTVHWHASDHPFETLHTYADLVAWAQDKRLLSHHEATALVTAAVQQPKVAAKVLQRGLELREAIYRTFIAYFHGKEPHEDDLARLNQELSLALGRMHLVRETGAFVVRWADGELLLERVLWSVIRSAVELLTSPELLARVGQCADDRGCGLLFLDTSKNRSRQWCDINDCGNRAKQRRHYQRTRQQPS